MNVANVEMLPIPIPNSQLVIGNTQLGIGNIGNWQHWKHQSFSLLAVKSFRTSSTTSFGRR